MMYRYRLTARTKTPGLFRFEEPLKEFSLDGHTVQVVPRDATSLAGASLVHFDGFEFPDEILARGAGERLRLRLRVLDVVLGLGLHVPVDDTVSGGASDELKHEVSREHDVVVVDSVRGLSVHPNDGRHVELVMSARADVHKPDGIHLIKGIQALWAEDIRLDQSAEDALAILGVATREPSDRARFLTTYLAMETVIHRSERSDAAKQLLSTMADMVKETCLEEHECRSLTGSLSALRIESFSSALIRFADKIESPPEMKGRPLRQFLSECIAARNAIAHRLPGDSELPLKDLTQGLREFALMIIWTQNKIPSLRIDVPGDQVTFPPGSMSIRVV
jgi:hypothetical protein